MHAHVFLNDGSKAYLMVNNELCSTRFLLKYYNDTHSQTCPPSYDRIVISNDSPTCNYKER